MTTDQDVIAAHAFRLFGERGYDATSMADIARASGIVRSTLYAYFPTKSDVLWVHYESITQDFERRLAGIPPTVPLARGAHDAFVAGLADRPEQLPLARQLLRVLASAPSKSTGKWDAFERYSRMLAEYAASRRGGDPASLEYRTLGFMLWSWLWTAIEAWALGDEPTPFLLLAVAPDLLDRVVEAMLASGPAGLLPSTDLPDLR